MSKYCPIVKRNVIYQYCEDCDTHLCKKTTESAENETWNGVHRNVTAPAGTFEKIWNDNTKEDNDI